MRRKSIAAFAALMLLAAACGGDDDDGATDATEAGASTEATATDATTEATGTEAPAGTDAPASTEPTEGTEGSDDTAAADGEATSGGIVTIPLAADPTTLDLMQESNVLTQQVAAQMYDTLVRWDPTKLPDERELIGSLATEWTQNDDATELTVTLRDGVTFHDGEPFTSDDVRATIERARDAPDGTVSIQGSLLKGVTVETPDELTAILRSETPNPLLLSSLATPAFVIVPAHIVDADPHGVEQTPMGTGPYKLTNWDHGTAIELERNPDYWNDPYPYLDGLKYVLMPDVPTRTSAFVAGNIQLSGQGVLIPAPEWPTLEDQVPGTTLYPHGTATIFQTFFNIEQAPFDDPLVRQAFAMVADQNVMGERAFEGYTVINTYGSAVGLDYSLPDDELQEHPGIRGVTDEDRDAARALLAEAGYPDGLEVDYLVGDVPQYVALAEVYTGQLAEIGVTANMIVQPLDAEVTPATREGRFQMAQTGVGANFYDPCLTLAAYTTATIGTTNYARYSNPEVDQLHAELCSSTDPDVRTEDALEIQRILWEDVPTAISANTQYIQGARPEVKGVPSPGLLRENLWLETIWLDS